MNDNETIKVILDDFDLRVCFRNVELCIDPIFADIETLVFLELYVKHLEDEISKLKEKRNPLNGMSYTYVDLEVVKAERTLAMCNILLEARNKLKELLQSEGE